MTSFNHYALGSVAHFLHSVIGGLSPLTAGWKKILIKPRPGGTLTSADTHHLTPYGKVSCEWQIEGNQLSVKVEVPPNTTAQVVLPGETKEVGSGKHDFRVKYERDVAWPPKQLKSPMPDAPPRTETFIP